MCVTREEVTVFKRRLRRLQTSYGVLRRLIRCRIGRAFQRCV